MGKLSGSYESVVRGVSEQAPQNRRSGQHYAQVNMISDPVRGLARRHGSLFQDEVALPGVPTALYDLIVKDTAEHRVFSFYVGNVEYDMIVRTRAAQAGLGQESFCWVFDKANGVFMPVVYSAGDSILNSLISGGVSAFVNIGRYAYLAGNTISPQVTTLNGWDNDDNRKRLAVTVITGAYSRKFQAKFTKADGTIVTATYDSPSSGYGGSLDTSDIILITGHDDDGNAILNPNYQKEINDRVNEYNSAVTAWITTAAEGIVPSAIAAGLAASMAAQGYTDVTSNGGTLISTNPAFIDVVADDGGDGSLLRAVGQNIDNVDLVNTYHWVGKIVRVPAQTTNGNAVYLKAVAKDGQSTEWAAVIWRETAGYTMTPQSVFAMATIENGICYIAGGPAELQAISGVTVPAYKANTVGDDLSCPLPEMFGDYIDYLGVFQDRLVIGSGATLLFSRPGDYLNWFRKSVTTVDDADPWEGFALGSEDDTIKWSALYDKNLLLFGKRFQYVVSGRTVFTPKTAAIVMTSAFEDAIDAAPQATGTYVVYSKYSGRPGNEVSSVHQVQAGQIEDTPESYKISQQLDTYLTGIPVEIVTLTAPNMVILRTSAERDRVFTYSYIDDAQQGRLFDSWSEWRWSEHVGQLIGMSRHQSDAVLYMIKQGVDASGDAHVFVSAERFALDTALSEYPYLDSLRNYVDYRDTSSTLYLNPTTGPTDGCAVALGRAADHRFIGLTLDRRSEFEEQYGDELVDAWVGAQYDTYVTPTNPYPKDSNDRPILTGRMTLGYVHVAVSDTGGMEGYVTRFGTERQVINFTGRILGASADLIGYQPIVSTSLPLIIGGEVSECSYTLKAKTWLPLTITSLDWIGQLFFNVRRA